MKYSEIINANYDRITEELISDYRSVIESEGRIQYKVYIWEDGEIETLCGPQGDNSWLKPRDAEPRHLYCVTVVDADPSFSIWDYSDEGEPDDEDERETMRAAIIDWLVDEYSQRISETMDEIISEAEEDEQRDMF